MSAEAAIVPLLTGLVSGRVYPDVAPSGAGLPRIVYQQVGGQALNYTEGTLPADENARMQIVCWAATRAAAIALMKQAEAGDGDAIKLLVQIGVPRTKAVSIPVALPGGPDGVLAALEAGEIAPDEAKAVMAVHLDRVRIKEIEELEQRLAALERAVQEKGSDR